MNILFLIVFDRRRSQVKPYLGAAAVAHDDNDNADDKSIEAKVVVNAFLTEMALLRDLEREHARTTTMTMTNATTATMTRVQQQYTSPVMREQNSEQEPDVDNVVKLEDGVKRRRVRFDDEQ